ncbi:glycoside hydrolase family 88 protein [Nakamurella antarctica]|nr:glycoside hydrolase family 88 protein [Nakamurella antarctica]
MSAAAPDTAPEDVAWGSGRYVAADDAASALADTRRAGAPAHHIDSPALAAEVADRLIDLAFSTWGFGDSVAFDALVTASERLGDERWARFAHGWGRAWATRAQPFVRLDCTAPGRALAHLAVRYQDAQLLAALRQLADYLMSRPVLNGVYETWQSSPLLSPYSGVPLDGEQTALLASPPPGVFVDCLHFDPPFLVALGLATGESRYTDAGIDQALGYIALLQTDSGLFDHFALRGQPQTFGPGWGRGQGWAMLGMLDVLESLRENPADKHAEILAITTSVERLLRQMIALQRSDGHWYAVVTDSLSGNEFSTAAFMVVALAQAVRMGVLQDVEVIEPMQRARKAVLASLDADAQLREVSAAVYASTEPSHYASVPRGFVVPWGQGPALLALLAAVMT